MRNSDPRVRSVFVHRFNSDFRSVFTLQVTGCDFQYGPILVFPLIQPFGSVDFSSRGKMYSRHATGSVNCENSSVCFVMKYCPTSTVSGILLQYKSLSLDLVVEGFPLVPCTSAKKNSCAESQSKVWVSLSIGLLARRMGEIALPIRVSPFLFDKYCIPHTHLRLLCRY